MTLWSVIFLCLSGPGLSGKGVKDFETDQDFVSGLVHLGRN
jgi:hypothetical protein